jgi:acetolactate synthase-1/2/3 large subunit
MMGSQELETAVRMKLDLVVVILNDACYQMIRWKQERMQMDEWGLEFGNPDFKKLAESFGAHGHTARSIEEYEQMLSEALAAGGVHVIDTAIDYEHSLRDLEERG